MAYYPAGACVTAVDLRSRMLQRATARARKRNAHVNFAQMTAEPLAFPDGTFDWAVATFVFCSVPDPVAGLRERGGVCKPGGTVLPLEHVRIAHPIIGPLMDMANRRSAMPAPVIWRQERHDRPRTTGHRRSCSDSLRAHTRHQEV